MKDFFKKNRKEKFNKMFKEFKPFYIVIGGFENNGSSERLETKPFGIVGLFKEEEDNKKFYIKGIRISDKNELEDETFMLDSMQARIFIFNEFGGSKIFKRFDSEEELRNYMKYMINDGMKVLKEF